MQKKVLSELLTVYCRDRCAIIVQLSFSKIIVLCCQQMEAKAIMSRLLQQFRVSLPEGYQLRVEAKGSVQPKGTVPCILVPV